MDPPTDPPTGSDDENSVERNPPPTPNVAIEPKATTSDTPISAVSVDVDDYDEGEEEEESVMESSAAPSPKSTVSTEPPAPSPKSTTSAAEPPAASPKSVSTEPPAASPPSKKTSEPAPPAPASSNTPTSTKAASVSSPKSTTTAGTSNSTSNLLTSLAQTEAALQTTNHVYIRDDNYAWIPARVEKTDEDGNTAHVVIPEYKDERSIQSDGGRRAKRFRKDTVNLAKYPNKALPLQNVDEKGFLKEVEDMVDLSFLHEAAIMYNLKARHVESKPYTRTGDIVIAVNPYKWLLDLYTEERRHEYATALVFSNSYNDNEGDPRSKIEPHVYEASSLAYRGLAVDGEDQSILVSGESGAGKTETVKILMNDLASVQRDAQSLPTNGGKGGTTVPSPERKKKSLMVPKTVNAPPPTQSTSVIVQRVLDSNPLLEAFGNAKTLRNDNSSRFGKYIQLQFHGEDPEAAARCGKQLPSCVLAGSKCEVYLLEKSRVVSHEEEERTFHIFYQLLNAPEEVKQDIWEGLEDTDNESYCYVGFTETEAIEGLLDEERFQHTIDSLALVGVEGDTFKMLMRAICIVLQLGNLVFEPDQRDDDKTEITATEELDGLSELMGVAKEDLIAALTLRTVRARGEEYKVPLNSERARDSTDAFAKEIYAKTFLWLVRQINDATCAERNYDGDKRDGFGIIGLLDIFGFESFEVNRFEQLCINYANEKLQQKFTQDIFRSVQAEYEYEGIELGEITYDDNTDVLDLVEGRMGLLSFLNEECVRPKGSDKSFVSKVDSMNKDSPCWYREKAWSDTEFGIVHYAGKVVYDATNFVTKNMDTLPSDLEECAFKSTNDILANALKNDGMMNVEVKKRRASKRPPTSQKQKRNAQRRGSIAADSVWTKFRGQLTNLMTSLDTTRTRYIRCIKPNQMKEPLEMEHLSTIEQLRCAGVVAAVTISRSAFPNRLEHEVVLERFKSLWGKGTYPSEEVLAEYELDEQPKFLVENLLAHALKALETERKGQIVRAFVIGKSRAYFRAGSLEYMEAERLKFLSVWALEIQRVARGFTQKSKYKKIKAGMIFLEAQVRMKIALRNYRHLRVASIRTQCWIRCIFAARLLVVKRRNYRATMIQTHWRMAVSITNLKINRKAAIEIQTMTRGALQRPKFRQALHEKREEAKLENQLRALQRKLEEAEQKRIEAEKKAEEKAQKAVQEYRESTIVEEKKIEPVAPSAESVASAAPSAGPVTDETAQTTNDESIASAAPSVPSEAASAKAAEEEPEPAKSVPSHVTPSVSATVVNLTAQQQNLMDESGKMLEYLRKEVFKLRNQNNQIRTDFELVKDNNQRLMDANASAGASFAALNQHAKQLTKTNAKLSADCNQYRQTIQRMNVTQVELKEELKMKQATYIAEVRSRLTYQKALGMIVELASERCRDTRLVEDILRIADEAEGDDFGSSGSPNAAASPRSPSGRDGQGRKGGDSNNDSMYSRFKSYWS